jgi:nitrate reductase gamma subunit
MVAFVGGMIYRIFIWKKLPAPKMTLFPAPKEGKERFGCILKETFLFSSLFKADKGLWSLGWIFHAMLALIFIGHFRALSFLPDKLLMTFGMTPDSINTMSAVAGGGAGIVMLITAVIIVLRRMMLPHVREISNAGDYTAMILIIAILLTGNAMRFISHFDLAESREYFYGLLTFSAVNLPSNPWFLAHYALGQILIIYMPFSKILHFGGIFFTEALVHKH